MPDECEVRVWNFDEDGSLMDLFELDGLNRAFELWLDEVIQRPQMKHKVEWIATGEALWENDVQEAQYPAREGAPTQVWLADRKRWETPFMTKPDWWRELSDSDLF